MKLAIIKYNAGNIRSVLFALERIGINAIVTDDITEIQTADKVIFPGVGEASSAMSYLRERKLDKLIISLQQPVLGVCLGMQLMCSSSEEGNTKCLGIFKQEVKKFKTDFHRRKSDLKIILSDSSGITESTSENLTTLSIKVPQIGWNNVVDLKSGLFTGIKESEYMYFVHSYYVELGENTISSTNYGIKYSSSLQKNNFYATQFHPEKSGEAGQRILDNFIKL